MEKLLEIHFTLGERGQLLVSYLGINVNAFTSILQHDQSCFTYIKVISHVLHT